MRFECLSENVLAAPVPMDITPTQRILSACAGVLTTSLVVTPMDVVKTRVQAAQAESVTRQVASTRPGAGNQEPCDICRKQGRLYTTSARASSAAVTAGMDAAMGSASAAPLVQRPPPLPAGTWAALHHISKWEGPRGLYRGLDVSLVMAVPSTVLYYTLYDDFLGRLDRAGAGNVLAPVAAGSSARILATLCMAPLELVRTRTQSRNTPFTASQQATTAGGAARTGWAARFSGVPLFSVAESLASVCREEGVAALWRGVGTTMWRDVPFSMVYWLGYENLKAGLGCGRRTGDEAGAAGGKSRAEERNPADFLLRSFTAGAMSGVVASLLTHPFDVVKTQQQVAVQTLADAGCEHRPPPPPRHAATTFEVMGSIVESKGVGGLYTGALARVVKVAPACAIMIFSYEAGKRFFGERNAAAAATEAKATGVSK